jgi:hypothetical protein
LQAGRHHFVSRRSAVVDGSELIAFLRNQWKNEAEASREANSPSPVDVEQQLQRPNDEEVPA